MKLKKKEYKHIVMILKKKTISAAIFTKKLKT